MKDELNSTKIKDHFVQLVFELECKQILDIAFNVNVLYM